MPTDPPTPASSGPTAVLSRDADPPGAVQPATPPRWDDGPERGSVLHPACAACDRVAFHPGDPTERDELVSPEIAAQLLVPRFAGADRERCLAALLDTKHRLLEVVIVSVGSLDHTFMSPREVFRDALLANAAAVVLGHNHPSGDPEPSRDDELVTRRLVRAGELVGVEVLDHLVVAGERWISLARRGLV
jgi:DNA repair protein RadC